MAPHRLRQAQGGRSTRRSRVNTTTAPDGIARPYAPRGSGQQGPGRGRRFRTSATSWARSRRRKARPSRPTSSAASCVGNDADREVVGSGGAVGDPRRRRRAGDERARAPTRRGVASPADASTDPSTSSALQSARNSARVCSTRSRCSVVDAAGRAQGRGRLERVEARVGEVVDRSAPPRRSRRRPPRSRGRAGRSRPTCAAATANSSTATLSPRSSTSMPTMSPSHGTDAGRDETERAGTVGEPDPHEDVRGRLGGVAHGIDGTGLDDANVSPR